MKSIRKIVALLLAVLLCFSVAAPALAVESEGPDELCATAETVSDEKLTDEELDDLLNTEGAVLDLEKLTGTATDDSEEQTAPVAAPRMRAAAAAPRAAGSPGTLVTGFRTCDGYNLTSSEGGSNYLAGCPAKTILQGGTQYAAYCIDAHSNASNGHGYTEGGKLSANEQLLIGNILANGYFQKWSGATTSYCQLPKADGYKWMITQMMVWAVRGKNITLDKDKKVVISAKVDADANGIASHLMSGAGTAAAAKSYYQDLKQKLIASCTVPSFMYASLGDAKKKPVQITDEFSMNPDFVSKTFEDKNKVLNNFTLTKPDGVDIEDRGDNSVEVVLSKEETFPTYIIEGKGKAKSGNEGVKLYRPKVGGDQTIALLQVQGDVKAYLVVSHEDVSASSSKLIKYAEDDNVAGISFTFSGSDGKSMTLTTDSNGEIDLSSLPAYEKKEEEDPDTGEKREVDDLTKPITYTVTENTPIQYVSYPSSATFTPATDGDAELEFENRLKKWRVTVTKQDSETGNRAQGDATLQGAKYEIWHNGQKMDEYMTDANGRFTSYYYVCGSGYTLREVDPSTGYLLNEAVLNVGMTPQETNIEYNQTSKTVTEDVKKNRIFLYKHKTDKPDADTEWDVEEEGAAFQVYLSAAGSYDAAYETERDELTTDEHGIAISKLLPYGKYTVHQVSGTEGHGIVADREIFISEDVSETGPYPSQYFLSADNAIFHALVKVMKKDSESGRVIPASGIGFRVKNTDTGEYVIQHINYPEPMDLEVYYTNVTGTLILPYDLVYGNYQLEEVQTAYGYVLDEEPVPFKVDGTLKEVVVEKRNVAQKGVIVVEKKGEVFEAVDKSGELHTPVYEMENLAGAVYEITAAQDILTGDGTLRYAKDTVVDTVTTAADGKAKSKPLYLGYYYVTEKTAPDGMVLNTEPQLVLLSYAGQTVELTEVEAPVENQKQRLNITLKKELEEDKDYKLGMNGEQENVVFGLYAAEEFTAANGSKIPTDGLVATARVGEDFTAAFDVNVPFGKYYVKEYAPDKHYVLSDTKYPVEFEYQGQEFDALYIRLNDDEPIGNRLIRGKVLGLKWDEDGLTLGGAVMGIFAPGTEEYTKENAIATSTSQTDGSFSFEGVPYGAWIVHEIESPEGFILSDEPFPVVITEDKQVVKIDIENYFIKGDVHLIKIDKNYPDHKLSGAKFAIYDDGDGDGVYTEELDPLVGYLKEVQDGYYEYKDLPYGKYIVRELEAPEGYQLDENDYPISVTEAGQVIDVKNSAKGFTNAPIGGKLHLTKTDVSTGKVIPNAGFMIRDEKGKTVAKGYTDKNGVAIFELPIGKYTYQEFDAPKGYILDETPHAFEIKEAGEIVKAKMTNTPKNVRNVPKTGDDNTRRNLLIAGGVLIAALLAGGITLVVLKKRRK